MDDRDGCISIFREEWDFFVARNGPYLGFFTVIAQNGESTTVKPESLNWMFWIKGYLCCAHDWKMASLCPSQIKPMYPIPEGL